MKSIPEASVDTRLLHGRLVELTHGEEVSYEDLSKIIGRDVRGRARSNLQSARRMAERDGVVLGCVRDAGLKRLQDEENVLSSGADARERSRRIYGRAIRRLTAVQFEKLPPELQIKQNAELSQLGALRAFAGDRATKKLETRVKEESGKTLALAKTLEVFSK